MKQKNNIKELMSIFGANKTEDNFTVRLDLFCKE